MTEERPDFRQAFRKLTKTLWSGQDDEHPPTEVLVAYHDGELSEEEADRVQEHLAACTACADRLLEYDRFGDEDPEDEMAADQAKGRDWETIHRKLEDP